jgi:hypothetical protein
VFNIAGRLYGLPLLVVPEPERVAIMAPLSLDHLELPLEVGAGGR